MGKNEQGTDEISFLFLFLSDSVLEAPALAVNLFYCFSFKWASGGAAAPQTLLMEEEVDFIITTPTCQQ